MEAIPPTDLLYQHRKHTPTSLLYVSTSLHGMSRQRGTHRKRHRQQRTGRSCTGGAQLQHARSCPSPAASKNRFACPKRWSPSAYECGDPISHRSDRQKHNRPGNATHDSATISGIGASSHRECRRGRTRRSKEQGRGFSNALCAACTRPL